MGNLILFKDLIEKDDFKKLDKLDACLGTDTIGNNLNINIKTLGNTFLAGATGSGVDSTLYNIIISLILKNEPNELKLILLDPLKCDLELFRKLPHAINLCSKEFDFYGNLIEINEMIDIRIKTLDELGYKDIYEYNLKENNKMEVIAIAIDWANDFFEAHGKAIEKIELLIKMFEKTKRVGFYFIVATHRLHLINKKLIDKFDSLVAFLDYPDNKDSFLIDNQDKLVRTHFIIKNDSINVEGIIVLPIEFEELFKII